MAGGSDSEPGSPRLGLSELSADTLAALQAVLRDRAAAAETAAADPFRRAAARLRAGSAHLTLLCSGEDWSKSQFVYDQATARTVATEVAALGGSVACVSCPTLFRTLKDDFPAVACHLLEFDERYSCRGDFTLYDYNEPLRVPDALRGAFDVVVADPPYLAEECLLKTAETVRLLQRTPDSPVLLLTGAVMQPVAERALGCRPCVFRPQHRSKLGNEFYCYANFDATRLGGWDASLQQPDAEGAPRPAAA